MPALSQVSTQQAPSFAGLSPLTPEYGQAQVQTYAKNTQPQYQSGLRDLRSYMRSSRGLGDSGIEASQVAGLEQSRQGQLGDYAGQVGQQQAQANEAERQAQRNRSWQVQDQQWQAKQAQEARDAQERAGQAQLWSQMLNPVGQLAGYGMGRLFSGGANSQGVPDTAQPPLNFMPQGIPNDKYYGPASQFPQFPG